jgi:hypothetical protein
MRVCLWFRNSGEVSGSRRHKEGKKEIQGKEGEESVLRNSTTYRPTPHMLNYSVLNSDQIKVPICRFLESCHRLRLQVRTEHSPNIERVLDNMTL